MDERRWKVGELADATGVTVRTLHHFDEIGLLLPAERSPAGHRLYVPGDVRRLYRVLALRQLGMPLGEIATALDGDPGGLELAVRRQLEQVERHLELDRRLRDRLRTLLRAIRDAHDPTVDQLIETMEAMMQSSNFTPEQLAQMRGRHQDPGFQETMAAWKSRGAAINDEVSAHIERGTDPADDAVQDLARRWSDLLEELAGGDRTIRSALVAKLDVKGPEATTQGALSAATWDYLKRAFAVGFGSTR